MCYNVNIQNLTHNKNKKQNLKTEKELNTMKKIISLVMCAVLLVTCAFALTSCGSKDTKIGLQSGTTSEMYAKALNGIEVVSFDTFALAATDMKNGNVDYVFCDKTTAAAICGEIDGLKIVDVALAQEFYGIAIDKKQADLKTKIDAILADYSTEIKAMAELFQQGKASKEIFTGVVSAEKDASKADKQLVLATNAEFAPFESVESKDGVKTYYGIDMEIAKLIAHELDMELVIEDMKFETVVGAVGNNGVDIAMSGLTITAEREEVVNFSTPYFTEDIVLVCKADDKTFDACKTVVDIFAIICNPSEK